MKKIFIVCFSLTLSYYCLSQIEVVQFLPKNGDKFNIGFGAALKFKIAVSEAASATIEGGVVYSTITQSDNSQGIALVPVKLGYRYTLNGTGEGFYVEPQAGYCVYGAFSNDLIDENISGFDWAFGIGYLFPAKRRSQFEIGLRYETVHFKKEDGGSQSFIALRVSSNFSFRARDVD